jgi:hypothetical protein
VPALSLIGFYPVDSFAQFVEIANGVAVAIGAKKSLHRLSHDSEFPRLAADTCDHRDLNPV